jgi:hypothetical protein
MTMMPAVSIDALVVAVHARQLDRRLVGLAAGIAEEPGLQGVES